MRLVMFDIDGTLTQTITADASCYVRALSELIGGGEIDSDWSTYEHVTDTGIAIEACARAGRERPTASELAELQAKFTRMLGDAIADDPWICREVPGARALMSRLRSEPNVVVALATGGWASPARLKLRSAGITLDGVAFASSDDDVTREGIMRCAARRAAYAAGVAEFDSCVYVGDGVWDARCSQALGYSFVARAAHADAKRLLDLGACCALADFADVDACVAALAAAHRDARRA